MATTELTKDDKKQLREFIDKMRELARMEPQRDTVSEHSADALDTWLTSWGKWYDNAHALEDEYMNIIIKGLGAAGYIQEDTRKSEIYQNPPAIAEIIAHFLNESEIIQSANIPDILKTDFLPLANNNSLNNFRSLNKENFIVDDIENTATYTNKRGEKYRVTNWDKIYGQFGTSTKKMLDTAVLYLTYNNYYRSPVARATVEIPLIEYGEANGRSLTPRKMETDEEQKAENNRVDERIKDFKKSIRRDLYDIKSVEFSMDKTKGKKAGDCVVGSIISSFRITTTKKRPIIRINFDVDIAQNLIDSYIMQFPTVLLKHSNKNPNGYAIGCKIAAQNSNDNNIIRGTENTLKVKTLLDAAPEITSYEALQAQGQRNWKDKIKKILEKAINSNVEIGYIQRWEYRDPRTGNTYTPKQADAMTWDEYYNLNVDFILLEHPQKLERLRQKETEKARKADEKKTKKKSPAKQKIQK